MAEMDDEMREKLKSALWFSIGKIVDEESLRQGVNATPQFIGALTELVWAQCEALSTDLTSFAAHAGRSTITTADVLLVSRRNPALEGVMRDFVEADEAERVLERVRARTAGKGSGGARKNKGKGRG